MNMRKRRKQFWYTWHHSNEPYTVYSRFYGWFDWGVARIKHQIKHQIKE